MLFSRWLQSLKRKHRVSGRPLRPWRQGNRELVVEFLENRLVLSSNQDFVHQAFLDLLHRPVDAGSLTTLAGALDAATVHPTDVAGFIVTSLEARAGQTEDLFNRYLHRSADVLGRTVFTNFLLDGGTLEQAGAAILGSPEYFANRGGNDNLGFLNSLYQDVLGRPIDPTGQASFTAALNAGASREALAGFVLTSPEYRTDLVQNFFETYLHRPAEGAAVNVYTNALNTGMHDETVVAFIVASPEYFARANPVDEAPTVTLASAAANLTNESPIPVTATFSTSVTGFTSDDLTVGNGSISNFVGSGAVYTFDLTPTSQGAVTVGIAAGVAQDAAGTPNLAAASFSRTFDNIAPAAPTISSSANHALIGTAEAGSSVAVSLDGTLLGTTRANSVGAWSFDYNGTTLKDGTHTFTATATDAAGNISAASNGLSFVLDTTPPAAPTITNFSSGALTGTAEKGSTVKVFEGTTVLGSTQADPSDNWTLAVSFGPGNHTVTATATDAAHNQSVASAGFLVANTTPPDAPTVTFSHDKLTGTAEANSTVKVFNGSDLVVTATANTNGIWSAPPTLVDGIYQLSATATDAAGNISPASSPVAVTIDTTAPPAPTLEFDHGVLSGTAEASSTVNVFNGSAVVATTTADANNTWTAPPTLADGTYQLTATATDAAGNVSPASLELDKTIDTTPPAAPTIAGFHTGKLSGTAEANSTVQVFNGNTVVATATTDANGDWSAPPTLADGTYQLTATATDAATNVSPASSPAAVTIDTVAPPAPTIAGFHAGKLSGTAEASSTVKVFKGSSPVVTTTADANGNWSAPPTLPNGSYQLTATATDAAGNISPVSSPVAVTIHVPAVPVIAGFIQDQLRGTAEANSTVNVFNGTDMVATATADTNGIWSAPPTLPNGSYQLTATATNAAANTSPASSPVAVTIDVPAVPAIAGFSHNQLTGTADANSTVNVFNGTVIVATAAADASGAWSASPTLPNGSYQLTATATNAAENTSPASSPVAVTIHVPEAPTLQFDQGTRTLSGTAEASSTVTVYDGSTVLATVTANADNTWTATPTLPDGPHHFTATATDAAGNISPVSNNVFLTTGTPPPTSIATYPVDTDPTNPITPSNYEGSIQGTASDNGNGVQKVEVSILKENLTTGQPLYWDGSSFNSIDEKFFLATGTTSWSFSFSASNFPEFDAYDIHSRATDMAGQVEATAPVELFFFQPG